MKSNLRSEKEALFTPIDENISFNEAFTKLEYAANSLSGCLDVSSKNINSLEKRLQELNTNIPFHLCVYKHESEVKSAHHKYKNCDLQYFYLSNGYTTENNWCLFWDVCETSKTFRLIVIGIEIDYGYSSNFEHKFELKKDIFFKKPLIECKLDIRLKFAKFITPFILHFTKHLENYSSNIKNESEFKPENFKLEFENPTLIENKKTTDTHSLSGELPF